MRTYLFVLLLCVPMLVRALVTDTKTLKKGDKCPAFVFKDTEGRDVTLGQFEGKYIVVDVWASWCQPCKKELPNLKKLEEKYKDKNIVFVSISCDQNENRWKFELGFLREKLSRQWWLGKSSDFMTAFGIYAIPRLLLLDKKGFIVNTEMPKPSDPKFDEIIGNLKGL